MTITGPYPPHEPSAYWWMLTNTNATRYSKIYWFIDLSRTKNNISLKEDCLQNKTAKENETKQKHIYK
jgi:hypothetical protein